MAYIVCTSNLDLVSFLFVPALYSTLKLFRLLVYIYIHVGELKFLPPYSIGIFPAVEVPSFFHTLYGEKFLSSSAVAL